MKSQDDEFKVYKVANLVVVDAQPLLRGSGFYNKLKRTARASSQECSKFFIQFTLDLQKHFKWQKSALFIDDLAPLYRMF